MGEILIWLLDCNFHFFYYLKAWFETLKLLYVCM